MPDHIKKSQTLGGLGTWAERVIDALLALLLLSIVLITLAQVFWRYVIGNSFVFQEEVNLLLWAWMIGIGSIVVHHLSITMFVTAFGPRVQIGLAALQCVVSLILLAVLFRYGLSLAALTKFDRFGDMNWLTRDLVFLSVPVVAVPWAVVLIVRTTRTIRDLRAPRADGEPA